MTEKKSTESSTTTSATEELLKKYPLRLVKKVRQRFDREPDDTTVDAAILGMSRAEFFNHVLTWEGFIGYGSTILDWVGDVYGVDFGSNEISFKDPEKGTVTYR